VRQSHLEKPWIDAWALGHKPIDDGVIERHFKAKFCFGNISYPEVVFDAGIFELDRIPVRKFNSIEEMANAFAR
jgi:hypothetical protein